MLMYKESKYNLLVDTDSRGRKLIFNTVMGSVCWFDADILEKFVNKNNISIDLIPQELIKMGFVVASDLDEYGKLTMLKNSIIYTTVPGILTYVIAPTMLCNLKCEYCFEQDKGLNVSMSTKTWDLVYDFITQQISTRSGCKKLRIAWFGGEPCLTSSDIIRFSKKIIDYTTKKGIGYSSSMSSNGLLLNRPLAETMVKDCLLNHVQITIDGLDKTYCKLKGGKESDFYQLIKNIVEISDILKVTIRINVNNQNKNEIIPLLKFMLDEMDLCGKVEVYLAPIKDYLKTEDNTFMNPMDFSLFRKEIIEFASKNNWIESFSHILPRRHVIPCSAMKSSFSVIAPDGNLYRCEHCIGMAEWSIGDVEQGFYYNQADTCFLRAELPEKCSICKLFPICSGGCVSDRILNSIDLDCKANEINIVTDVKIAVEYKKKLTLNGFCDNL